MSERTRLNYQIDKIEILDNNEEKLTSRVKVYIMREGNNSHDMPITREAARLSKRTLANKPILCHYDRFKHDFGGHSDELIVGVFTDNIEEIEEDGKLWIVAEGIIFKAYYQNVMDVLLKKDFETPVSMEIDVLETEEIDGVTHITLFSFTGVTLLGVTPAIENARAIVTRFSKDRTSLWDELKLTSEAIKNIEFALDKNLWQNDIKKFEGEEKKMEERDYRGGYVEVYLGEYVNPDTPQTEEHMAEFMKNGMKDYMVEGVEMEEYERMNAELMPFMKNFMDEYMKDETTKMEDIKGYMQEFMKPFMEEEADRVWMSEYACDKMMEYAKERFEADQQQAIRDDLYAEISKTMVDKEVYEAVVEKEEQNSEMLAALNKKFQELQTNFDTASEGLKGANDELETLKEFKAVVEKGEYQAAVDEEVFKMSAILSDEESDKIKELVTNYSYESLGECLKEIKLIGYEASQRIMKLDNDGALMFAIPTVAKKKKSSLWEQE